MRQLTLMLVLLIACQLPAQDFDISLNVPQNYELYYIGDLDPTGGLEGVGEEITLAFRSSLMGAYTGYAVLEYNGFRLVDGNFYSSNVQPINYGPWTLNDIRNSATGEFNGRGEYNEDFTTQVSGNTLPAGVYQLHARMFEGEHHLEDLREMTTGFVANATVSFTIIDPRQVELQLPWDGAMIFAEQPNFTWSGRARRYGIRVCRFDSEFHSSMQEALEGDPEWVNEDLHSPGTAYGQGGSAARPLEPGETYVWQVCAILETTSGVRRFPTEIRSFRFLVPGGGDQPMLAELLRGLSPGQLAGLAQLLEGMQLDGPIMIDGRRVTPHEFQEFLQEIANGDLNIASMRIE